MNKILQDLQDIFRDIFDDDEIILQDHTSSKDIEDWDSLAQMSLIAAIEKHFQIKFKIEEIVGLKNVGEMVELIHKKTL